MEDLMQMQRRLAGWTTLGALASSVIPAIAQVQPQTQEIHGYVGELFGDELTDTQVSGLTPTLDDDVTYGIRYGYNVTQTWGLELSLGYNPNEVTELTGGDSDLDLATLDVDMVWNFNPGGRLVPYVLGGVGHASANLD
jgi:opacity protein-like surface antigen